jgi:flagellin
MPNSILTNQNAMVAVQSLNATNKAISTSQSRISTGLKVGNAADNAATYAISAVMKSDIAAYKSIKENLALGTSIVSTARSASETVTKLIDQIKGKVTSAESPAIDRSKTQADIEALIAQVGSVVGSASLNGVNLVNGAAGKQQFLSSVDRSSDGISASYIDVATSDLRMSAGGGLEALKGLSVLSTGDQLLTNATDAEKKVTFTVGAASANGTMNFTYTDKSGKQQSISTSIDAGTTAPNAALALQNNKAFDDAGFEVKAVMSGGVATGDVQISAKNRDYQVSFDSTKALTSSANTITAGVRTTELEFKDGVPLKMGEKFEFKYKVGTEEKTVKLQVGQGISGKAGMAEDGVTVYNINSDLVSDSDVTGATIATEIRTAILGPVGNPNTDFVSGAAVAGVAATPGTAGPDGIAGNTDDVAAIPGTPGKIGLDVAAGTSGSNKLILSTANAGAELGDFQFSKTDYGTLLSKVESALKVAVDSAASFGSAQNRLTTQSDFVNQQIDTFTAGVGTLVDADMTEESARLQALQTQQQLGIQALSMANQGPQQILSLFRG